MRPLKQSLSGWGNCISEDALVFRPEVWEDFARVVRNEHVKGLIPRGLGRAYGDAALNANGGVLLSDGLSRLLDFDTNTGILECEAGVSIGEILQVFVPRGYFLTVLPGTRHVSIGGAIAADIHGKNHHVDGSFASCVLDFVLLTANGETLNCSRTINPEAFSATLGGMGLTGMVLSARIKLQPISNAYISVRYRKTSSLEETLDMLAHSEQDYHYSVAWIDTVVRGKESGRAILLQGEHSNDEQIQAIDRSERLSVTNSSKLSVPFYAPNFVLNKKVVRLFNKQYYGKHSNTENVVHYSKFFFPLDSIGNWNRLYGKRGFTQYQVVFPDKTATEGMIHLLEKIGNSEHTSFLSVIKSLGNENIGFLSFPRKGYTLTIDVPNRPGLKTFIQSLNELSLKYNGRVYLAKDLFLDKGTFVEMYSTKLGAFQQAKQRLDPEHRFTSSLGRRLGLV